MLHRKLNQVWWSVAEHLHRVALQQLLQPHWNLNSTHARSPLEMARSHQHSGLRKQLPAGSRGSMDITECGASSEVQPDSSSSSSCPSTPQQQLIDSFIRGLLENIDPAFLHQMKLEAVRWTVRQNMTFLHWTVSQIQGKSSANQGATCCLQVNFLKKY